MRRLLSFSVALMTCLLLSGFAPLSAQETETSEVQPPEQPFAVVSVASAERMLDLLDFMFEAADRPEASDALVGRLAGVNDLQGLDQRQSFGMMIYLSGIMPQPVVFAPVTKIKDLMKTMESGPFTAKKIDEEHYELKGRRRSVFVKTVGGYAYFSNVESRLDRGFPDPAMVTAGLSTKYDIAATANLGTIPEEQMNLLAALLKASADTNLQQRDNEPKSAYKIRRATGENNARIMDQLLREAQELTLGWKLMREQRRAVLELTVKARPGTELSTLLSEMDTNRSKFANLLQGDGPLTFATTWKLDDPGKKMMNVIVDTMEEAFPPPGDIEGDPIARLFRAARGTVEAGSLDFVVRYLGEPGGPFVLLGGIKVKDGRAMDEGLADICMFWLEEGHCEDVELDAETHRGVSFHRIDIKENDPGNERIYGGVPSAYLGVSDDTLWLAIGGDGAFPVLMDQMDAAAEPVNPAIPAVPFQLIVNVSDWASLSPRNAENDGEGQEGRRGRFSRTVAEAFNHDNAALRLDLKSISGGARLRLEFQEGFLRFAGINLARFFLRD